MWFEEVKKNPFVVLGVHIFSGVAPCAVFVPPARNEKKKKKKRVKKKPECNNSPKSEDKLSEDSTDNLPDKI